MANQVTKNKIKGFNYERELVKRAEKFGVEAKRAWGSNGESLGEDATVDVMIGEFRVQAKRMAKMAAKYRLNIHQDSVVFREDGSPSKSQIIMRYDDFLKLMALAGKNKLNCCEG